MIIFIIGYLSIQTDIFDSKGDGTFEWENSIAVLPFYNLSNDPEQEYFCDGMTDQIITNLGSLPKLKVIGHQSMRKYKGSDKTISEIGKELNVAYILESSIRMSGDLIRVAVKLIDASNDFQLWSDNYDREYKELFNLQDDISENLARSLLKTLSGEDLERVKKNRPNNTEAWEYYIRAKYIYDNFFITWENVDDLKKTEDMLLKSIELDQEFVNSYALLVDLFNTYYHFISTEAEEKQKYLDLMEKNIHAGFEIDPQSAEMHCMNGWLLMTKGDKEGEFESYKKSFSLDPNNEKINQTLGVLFFQKGLDELAIKHFTRFFEIVPHPIDPYSFICRSICYRRVDNLKQAELDILKALELATEKRWAIWNYSIILITADRIIEAKKNLKKLESPSDKQKFSGLAKSLLYALNGESVKAIQNYPASAPWQENLYYILELVDESIDYLNKRNERKKQGVPYPRYLELKNSHIYDFLRSDPRFQEILIEEKIKYDKSFAKYNVFEL